MIHFYIGITVLIILAVLMIKYLNGGFNYTEEIIDTRCIYRSSNNEEIGKMFFIKRTYENGAIKIYQKELKI